MPAVRRASSAENSTLHSFETAYSRSPVTLRVGPAQRVPADPAGREVRVAGHRHHPGRGAGFQAAEQRVGQHEVPEVVDPEHQLEPLLGQAARPHHAGVVHQHVQRLAASEERARRRPAPSPGRPGPAAGTTPRRSRSRPGSRPPPRRPSPGTGWPRRPARPAGPALPPWPARSRYWPRSPGTSAPQDHSSQRLLENAENIAQNIKSERPRHPPWCQSPPPRTKRTKRTTRPGSPC